MNVPSVAAALRGRFATPLAHWRQSALGRRHASMGERERRLVRVGVGVALAALLYAGVYQPATAYRDAAVTEYLRQQSRLEWMQAHRADAESRAAEPAQRSAGQSLLTLVDSSAKAFDLRLARYQPDSAGGVSVVLEGQPFDAVASWTAQLASEHGIRVAQAAIDAQEPPGMVNARLRIR